jgi:amino acid permease
MLAYGILGATFIHNIIGLDFLTAGTIFFIVGGLLFFLSLEEVGKINFYLTLPLIVFAAILAFKLYPAIDVGNYVIKGNAWFLSYGVLVFAFGGYSALPDIKDVLGSRDHKSPKKIIFWSLFISAILYLLFIFSILGVSGSASTSDALSGIAAILGRGVLMLGSLIGIFTVFRAYVGFGVDLKLTYLYDYEIKEKISWLLAFLPPILLFLLGFTDLVKVLSIVGSVGLGVFAIFVLLMVSEKKKEVSEFVGFKVRAWWVFALGLLIVLGALQGVFSSLIF